MARAGSSGTLVIVSFLVVLPVAGASSWPTLGSDFMRTSRQGCGFGSDPIELWRYERPMQGQTIPFGRLAYGEGTVFSVTYPESTVFAVNATSGKLRWKVDLARFNGTMYPGDSPIVAEGMVFLPLRPTVAGLPGEGSGRLLALDAADGSVRWDLAYGVNTGPTTYHDGILYVSVLGHGLVAIRAQDGTIVWEFNPYSGGSTAEVGSPVLVDGLVVTTTSEPSLIAVDAATGQQEWRRSLGSIGSAPGQLAAHGDAVFVGTQSSLVAIDARSGHERWTGSIPTEYVASIAVDGGLVFAVLQGNGVGLLAAFEESDGSLAWSRPVNGGSDLLIEGDRVWINDNRETSQMRELGLRAYRRATGQEDATYLMPWVAGSPILVGHTLFATSYLILYALELNPSGIPSFRVQSAPEVVVGDAWYLDLGWPGAAASSVDVFVDGHASGSFQVETDGCGTFARVGPVGLPTVGKHQVRVFDGVSNATTSVNVVGLRWDSWRSEPPQPFQGDTFQLVGELENVLDEPRVVDARVRWDGKWLAQTQVTVPPGTTVSVVFDMPAFEREGVYLWDASAIPVNQSGEPTSTARTLQTILSTFWKTYDPNAPHEPPPAPPPSAAPPPPPPPPLNGTDALESQPGTSYPAPELVPGIGPASALAVAAIAALLIRRRD